MFLDVRLVDLFTVDNATFRRYPSPQLTIQTTKDFDAIVFGNSAEYYNLKFDVLNTFMKKCNCKRRPKYLMVERYHNNTHRIKKHLLLLDLLFRTPIDSQSKTSMCQELCYYLFTDHFKDSKCFCTRYSSKSPIEWYRDDSGLCRNLNRALRLKNFVQINNLRPFVTDLYQNMHEMHKRQKPDEQDAVLFKVHRGQQMYRHELSGLIKNVGQLVYNNSFLSTTFNQSMINIYAGTNSNTTESVAVLFEIEIDTAHVTQCYAHIPNSAEEQELITAPGTIFRLQSIEQVNNNPTVCNTQLSDKQNNELWLIKMKAIDEKQLLGETLTVLFETNMIGAGDPVVICLFLIFFKVT